MSKVVKGIGKGIKKIGQGIGKAFQKVTSSKAFKIAVGAAAIYFGGAALGNFGGLGNLMGSLTGTITGTPSGAGMDGGGGITGVIGKVLGAGAGDGEKQSGGIIGRAMGGLGDFIGSKDGGAAILSGLQGALTESPEDELYKEQTRKLRRQQQNMDLTNVNVGMRAANNQPLQNNSGEPYHSQVVSRVPKPIMPIKRNVTPRAGIIGSRMV